MNECYICFEKCLSRCKCKCNLYVHDNCIKQYGKIKNFYNNIEDNVFFIHCPICDETIIYNFDNDIIGNKIKKKKKCCI